MSTQPTLGRGITVTFKTVMSIACADATICISSVDGVATDRLVVQVYEGWSPSYKLNGLGFWGANP